MIANATGCSSVFASTFPFNPYNDPWVNSLFQDSAPVAKGIFEGLSASAVADFRALRTARLELDDAYDPVAHDAFFKFFRWSQFTKEELGLLPTVISMGGDGATYDIGFGALSRLLVTDTPIKVVVLNSGVYSNTGGQASTASYSSQDSDLYAVRQGAGGQAGGPQGTRPDRGVPSERVRGADQHGAAGPLHEEHAGVPELLGLARRCSTSTRRARPSTASPMRRPAEHGRLAVESRMSPVFVHDPRRGDSLSEWFSLEGNPEPDKDWASTTIEYVDADGTTKLLDMPLTPADFALQETRFKKHFRKLAAERRRRAGP